MNRKKFMRKNLRWRKAGWWDNYVGAYCIHPSPIGKWQRGYNVHAYKGVFDTTLQ